MKLTGDQRLDEALTRLARVFGNCRGSDRWTDGMSLNDSSVTLRSSVWELNDAEFKDYCWHSVTCSDPSTHRLALQYFMPRVVSDWANRRDAPWELAQLAYLLDKHDWQKWKPVETEAISAWLAEWVTFTARQYDSWRCLEATMLATVCSLDMNQFFHELRERDLRLSAIWLARVIDDHWKSLLKTGWPLAWRDFWGDWTPPKERAVRFIGMMLRESSIGILERVFFDESDEKIRSLFSAAHQHALDCIRFSQAEPDTPLAVVLATQQAGSR